MEASVHILLCPAAAVLPDGSNPQSCMLQAVLWVLPPAPSTLPHQQMIPVLYAAWAAFHPVPLQHCQHLL